MRSAIKNNYNGVKQRISSLQYSDYGWRTGNKEDSVGFHFLKTFSVVITAKQIHIMRNNNQEVPSAKNTCIQNRKLALFVWCVLVYVVVTWLFGVDALMIDFLCFKNSSETTRLQGNVGNERSIYWHEYVTQLYYIAGENGEPYIAELETLERNVF